MYLIFDTETTGLPKRDDAPLTDFDNWPRLVQIAWQLHDGEGKLIHAKNFIVKPEGFSIPYNAQKVHGISTERALNEGKDLKLVLNEFAEALTQTDLVVGHNVEFDLNIVGAEYLRNALENALEPKKWLCTKISSTDYVAIPGGKGGRFKWPTLTELYVKLFNEGFEDAHDAAYDVRATARCFFGLLTNKVVPTVDGREPQTVHYESPILDEANFAKIKKTQEDAVNQKVKRNSDELLPFVHLHVHSQFSILQSTAPVKKIVVKAKEKGMPAVAITDLGNLHAAFNGTGYGAEEGVKVIMGCEIFIAEDHKRLAFTKNEKDKRYQVVLLAKNKAGFQNLSKLVSTGYIEGLYAGIPRVSRELVKQYSEGLICLSGGISGEISNLILNEGEERAEKALEWWLDIFQDDFYLELMRHNLDDENYVNSVLVNFSKKYKIKVVATNNVYYLDQKDADAHDTLLCVKEGEKKSIPIGRGRGFRYGFPNQEFYFKSVEEMNDLFADIPEALENTIEIANKCESYTLKSKILMPNYALPPEFETQDDYLRYLAYEGAKVKYADPIPPDVLERIDFELNTIKNMGFPGYFLIVQDFINAGRKMGVAVGPGRGSAAGSAVAYCIGITNIDPIKYNLLFERFLNPERVSMPDIDIDFDDERRQDVIDYVVEKYGKNQVAQIITYGTMAAKMAIKDVARVLELDLPSSNQLAGYVPEKPGTKLKDAFAEINDLREILNGNGSDKRTQVLKDALILEGSVRNTGIHAAGVIIAPQDLLDCIPVCTAKDAELLVTQFDGKVIEEAGMLKMDFLGLKTLTIIRDALALIKKTKGIDIDIDKIDLEDAKTFELYQRGETNGTFQFESEGMQMYLRQLKPTNMEDLIAMNSLYRPGPLQFIPLYIDRKHGREPVEYPHPMLEQILNTTNGIMVYQEQIMQTAQILAGYSLGGADLLRRAMGKKKKEEMDKQREIFVKGSKEKNQIPEEKANEIFDIMQRFAEYGFNRSHSAAYSVVAYQTAFLKANYPAEYMAAVLTHNMAIEKVTFFLEECQRMGVQVLGPDVNESESGFTVNENGQIRFGLAAIKGTGEAAIATIIDDRLKNGKFKDIFDFTRRLSLRTVNKKSFESLAQAGAFDAFGIDRAVYFYDGDGTAFIEKLIKYGNAYQKDQESTTSSLFGGSASVQIATPPIPKCEPWKKLEQLNREKEVVGFYISAHPLDQYKGAIAYHKVCFLDQLERFDRQEVKVASIVTAKSQRQTKNGANFTVVMLEDYKSSFELALFNQDNETFSESFNVGELVLVTGKVQKSYRGDKFELKVNKVEDLTRYKEMFCKGLKINVDVQRLNQDFIRTLQDLCLQYTGKQRLQITLYDLQARMQTELTSNKFQIDVSDALLNRLEKMDLKYEMVY
jgi:DNA polymerase III subunit alpha